VESSCIFSLHKRKITWMNEEESGRNGSAGRREKAKAHRLSKVLKGTSAKVYFALV